MTERRLGKSVEAFGTARAMQLVGGRSWTSNNRGYSTSLEAGNVIEIEAEPSKYVDDA